MTERPAVPAPGTDTAYEHRSALFTYDAVARITPRSGRPVYQTRYLASCSCGWSTDAPDYIAAATGWRRHREGV